MVLRKIIVDEESIFEHVPTLEANGEVANIWWVRV